jgi:hypothetical protein
MRTALLALIAATGCLVDPIVDDPPANTYDVSGLVVDFITGEPAVSEIAAVTTVGLTPPPRTSVTGAEFTIHEVPPFSVFHILAASPPGYRNTYSMAVEVVEADVTGVEARVVSEEFLASLEEAFSIEPAAGTGVLIARAVDETGAGLAGIPGSAFVVNNFLPVEGPFFLGESFEPLPGASATSASGLAVFYGVAPGLVTVRAESDSGYSMVMPLTPTAATAVTIATIEVSEGRLSVPTGVSFLEDVMPIFARRGCDACHSEGEIGSVIGGLELDGEAAAVYLEITEEISAKNGVIRVDTEDPPASLLLTLPGPEDPPDAHPNVTFASTSDPDYLTILGWITDGAADN